MQRISGGCVPRTLVPVEDRRALRHGVDQDTGKKLQKLVKESKLKVQAQIQGDQLRVTGKSRDDLQAAMALLRKAEVDRPLQFKNFRD